MKYTSVAFQKESRLCHRIPAKAAFFRLMRAYFCGQCPAFSFTLLRRIFYFSFFRCHFLRGLCRFVFCRQSLRVRSPPSLFIAVFLSLHLLLPFHDEVPHTASSFLPLLHGKFWRVLGAFEKAPRRGAGRRPAYDRIYGVMFMTSFTVRRRPWRHLPAADIRVLCRRLCGRYRH